MGYAFSMSYVSFAHSSLEKTSKKFGGAKEYLVTATIFATEGMCFLNTTNSTKLFSR